MSKIQSSTPNISSNLQPQHMWEPEGPGHVRQLRRAITAHRDDRPVDTEVAPMSADLLARIDAFVSPAAANAMPGPRPPDASNPPTATETMQAMGQASAKLKQLTSQDGGMASLTPQQQGRVQSMVDAVDRHLGLKREVVLRVGQSQR